MTDSDQWKLSAYWHNEYNRAWHAMENMQLLVASGAHMHFCATENIRGERGFWFEITDLENGYGEGFSQNFLDAFWKAKDDFDMSRKVGPVDSDDRFESVERHEKKEERRPRLGAAVSEEMK